jgi:hypothetical protein
VSRLKSCRCVLMPAVSEDEFDLSAKQEAREYTAVQRNQSDRAAIKAENKARKRQGLSPLPLPAAVKVPRKRPDSSSEDEQSGSLLAGSGDSDTWVTKSGKRTRKTKKKQDDDLWYEGRECCPTRPG